MIQLLLKTYLKLFTIIFITLIVTIGIVSSAFSQSVRESIQSQSLVRDVQIDSNGNLYIITLHWTGNYTQLKSYSPDGEQRVDFKMVLPDFCCDPFPLEMIAAKDDHVYVLMPGKKQTVLGIDFHILKQTFDGKSDLDFGFNGSLSYPPGFGLVDFDISPDGTVWSLNESLQIHKFNHSHSLVKILEIEKVFPQHVHGERFEEFIPQRLFALDNDRLLLFGLIRITGNRFSPVQYYAAWEFDSTGKLVNREEWERPWYSRRHRGEGSFFQPISKATYVRDGGSNGSMLGFEEGFRDEPDTRKLSIIDWSIQNGFHFYNVISLELPKEIHLTYDMNQIRFARSQGKTILTFPLERNHNLLIVEYDTDGKIQSKFNVEAFR